MSHVDELLQQMTIEKISMLAGAGLVAQRGDYARRHPAIQGYRQAERRGAAGAAWVQPVLPVGITGCDLRS